MEAHWKNVNEVIAAINHPLDEVCRKGADDIMNDAKNILMSLAEKPTGKLASEIEIKKSRFEGGGYLIVAQGPGNYSKYYASFVEFGTSLMTMRKLPEFKGYIPYMRTALKRNRAKIYLAWEKALGGDEGPMV